ncbi:MAG: hypothetical protein K0S76_1710 [Herbinix sp.]|nr:hypothetical protein [Herbinix sp.]
MIIRKIKPEELKRTNELFAIAFECETDNIKSAKEVYEEVLSNPTSRGNVNWSERWAAFEDDDRTMMSDFIVTPFPVNFDGNRCTMTGIGGVATLPQYRRSGGIRACFEAALPSMFEDGVAFSYLYPFSTAYYRKFGYEMCCERLRYYIKLSAIRTYPVDGTCHLLEQGNIMLDEIKQIYEVWQNKYNMMIINEDYEYAWVSKSNPAKDQCFTYLYKSKAGVPKGFMTFRKEDDASGRNIRCSRFFYTDKEGFQGLINLLYTLASDHNYGIFELPTDQIITPLFPEWSMGAGRCEKVFWGMIRVINVEKVLQMASYKGDGSIVIHITDAFIPQNNHKFYVHFKEGKADTVTITEEPADISLGMNDFSRLIVGAYDTNALDYMEGVQINASLDKIAKVFYLKPNHITEYF